LGVGLLSRIPLRFFVSYFWLPVFAFSGLVALPAVFLTPGIVVSHVPLLDWPVTVQGLRTAALLLLRVETAVTLSGVLILTTAWPQVLHALRFFRVPVSAVVILGMTHRYLFLLLKNAHEMLEARQSRMLGSLPGRERRRLATASLAVLLSKTYDLSADVHAAMQSRGFHGEIYLLEEPAAGLREWLVLSLVVALAAVLVIAGR
jgi:cobalt ECF transporter T component CbiQ